MKTTKYITDAARSLYVERLRRGLSLLAQAWRTMDVRAPGVVGVGVSIRFVFDALQPL